MFWIIKFLPDVTWYVLLALSIIAILVTHFLPVKIPQVKVIKLAGFMAALLSIYFIGAVHNNQAWQARVDELNKKVAELEIASTETNTKIETKVVKQVQVVRERGQDIVQYVDREIVKYNNQCVIPTEFVTAHNRAAEPPK